MVSKVRVMGKKSPVKSGSNSGSSFPDDKATKEDFDALIFDLNMDSETSKIAWKAYDSIRQNYTLEGNQLHWLACALYVACRNSNLPTVSQMDAVIEGNGVSLTRLLRSCKLSLIQFFNKVKKWSDMSNLKPEFREKIERLERNFAVSNVIYKKYQPIFIDLFRDPSKDAPKIVKSRKQKKAPCTPGDVFDFCWTLFIRVKADFPAISDDLVNSYHLLLSCVDYIYANAVQAKRTDLLNAKYVSETEKEHEGPPCILDKLISAHDGIIVEVKTIREQYWKSHIKSFFDRQLLKGEPGSDKLYGILETSNFEVNAKMIRRDYEAYVLGVGEYDERVFLDENAAQEIGTPAKTVSEGTGESFGDKFRTSRNLGQEFDGAAFMPITPLSGQHYLKPKEPMHVTPVSTATYLVSRLNSLIGKNGPEPSEKLTVLLALCGGQDAKETVVKRINDLGETFCENYVASSPNHPGNKDSFAKTRLRMSVTLYYKLLEKILDGEKSKGKPLDNLIKQSCFHNALFACCLEIVIFSYTSQRTFPWVLDTFKLEPFHFYKVIEVIIRAEESLARDVVKHLQRIEEQVLESRAWTGDSPLWEALEREGVPSCEEVSLPGGGTYIRSDPTQSPISHLGRAFSVMRSPIAGDRFKSPVVTAMARRQLFDNSEGSVRTGQSLLASPTKVSVVSGPNNKQQIIIASSVNDSIMPKRTGGLGLFFRKFYHLAHLRLGKLCSALEVGDDGKRKIWTTFEHAICKETDLMKDRHLDQIIMCSLYIVCRVMKNNKNFTDIMGQYKHQPQAASHVYRSVLLRRVGEGEDVSKHDDAKKTTPPTPNRLAATSTIIDGEERGDLINFYNNVFLQKLQKFSKLFIRSNQEPPLSPLPQLRAHPASPCKKISDDRPVFIRNLRSTPGDTVAYNPHSPHKPLTYSFSRSPAKDLIAINALMKTEKNTVVRKRLLADEPEGMVVLTGEEEGIPPIKKALVVQGVSMVGGAGVNAKLESMLGDRTD